MSKHTPGPWEYRPGMFDDWGVVRCTAGFICQARNPEISFAQEQVHRSAKTDPAEANGRLIAAAPDMYAVLRELAECSEYWSEYYVPLGIHDRIAAALAKADSQ